MGFPNASLSEAIDLLEGPSRALRDQVLSGKSVPWFGSGISREVVLAVGPLLLELCSKLYENSAPADHDCPYQLALRTIIGYSHSAKLDPAVHPRDWNSDDWETAAQVLVDKYSTILGLEIQVGTEVVELRWDVINLIEIYSTPQTPDAEHEFIALLMAEGIWCQAVTTNWDALIECADELLSDGERPLIETVASQDEIAVANINAARLLKIHGCALKSSNDHSRYASALVGTENEILGWMVNAKPIYEALRDILRQRPVLFIGLSGQDFNLKAQFQAADSSLPFDANAPRISFSGNALSAHHEIILRAFYTSLGFTAHRSAILASSLVKLYAKPLLGALYIEMLFAKVALVLTRAIGFRETTTKFTQESFKELRQVIAEHYSAILATDGQLIAWRRLATEVPHLVSRCATLYRKYSKCASERSYTPLLPGHLAALDVDPNLPQLNYHWLLWVIALFYEGSKLGYWELELFPDPNDSKGCSFSVVTSKGARPIILMSDDRIGPATCSANGLFGTTATSDVLLIYPYGREPMSSGRILDRSVMTRGASHSHSRELWMADLYETYSSEADVIESLRIGVL